MSNRKDMPKHGCIVLYWCDKLIEENGKYWLDVFYDIYGHEDKLYYVSDKIAKESPCFACGAHGQTLHRAHIKAIADGGSNHVNNIHLLCKYCHLESECYQDEAYWSWFNKKTPTDSSGLKNALNMYKLYTDYLRDPDWKVKYGNLFEDIKNTYINSTRTIDGLGFIDYERSGRTVEKNKEERLKSWEAMFDQWIKEANAQI